MKTYMVTEEILRRVLAVGAMEGFAKTSIHFNNQYSTGLTAEDIEEFCLSVSQQNWKSLEPMLKGYEID